MLQHSLSSDHQWCFPSLSCTLTSAPAVINTEATAVSPVITDTIMRGVPGGVVPHIDLRHRRTLWGVNQVQLNQTLMFIILSPHTRPVWGTAGRAGVLQRRPSAERSSPIRPESSRTPRSCAGTAPHPGARGNTQHQADSPHTRTHQC